MILERTFIEMKKIIYTKLEEAKNRQEDFFRRKKRHIELGYIKGKVLPNGALLEYTPKKIQHWYDTKTLIAKVSEAFSRNESWSGRRFCPINGKWQLQIRGKHLRRLLKARPDWICTGRTIKEK